MASYTGNGLPTTPTCATMALTIVETRPGTRSNPTPQTFSNTYMRSADQYIAIGLDASQISDQMVVDARTKLNDANISKANGGSPSNEDLIGGLLNLALLRYFQECDHGEEVIAGLTGAVPTYNFVASGITSSTTTLQPANMSLQTPYLPTSLLFDVPNDSWDSVSIDGNRSSNVTRYNLAGYTNSSMEAAVWEELTNIPAISTVKSLQLAKTQSGTTVKTITHDDAANITGAAGTGILGNLSPAIQSSIKSYVQNRQDFTTYTETDPNSTSQNRPTP